LGQKHYLSELIGFVTQQFLNGTGYLEGVFFSDGRSWVLFVQHRRVFARDIEQPGFVSLVRHAAAAFGGALLVGRSHDSVLVIADLKDEFDVGEKIGRGMVGT
jgi:hypothetical protein